MMETLQQCNNKQGISVWIVYYCSDLFDIKIKLSSSAVSVPCGSGVLGTVTSISFIGPPRNGSGHEDRVQCWLRISNL